MAKLALGLLVCLLTGAAAAPACSVSGLVAEAEDEADDMKTSLLQRASHFRAGPAQVFPGEMTKGTPEEAAEEVPEMMHVDPTAATTAAPTTTTTTLCTANVDQVCRGGARELHEGEACEPMCADDAESVPVGWLTCRGGGGRLQGPGCVPKSELPNVEASDVDAVEDATSPADMVFKDFKLLHAGNCLLWPDLEDEVKAFIIAQADKFGPSAAAIAKAKKLGLAEKTEFFLSIEQISVLLAQLLCGATEVAQGYDLPQGGDKHPQAFAFGRAMQHWYFAQNGSVRDETWRRTTLVGYGTFDSDSDIPTASSTVDTGLDLVMKSGCGKGKRSDFGLGDTKTLSVIFAGHYVGGWMDRWHHSNAYGAQEEKAGTLVPEMMLATEPLRKMGAGLLSSGAQDPWLPQGGWYIIGAGSYVEGKGYPRWGSEKVKIRDDEDYFSVGTGRRIRRRGLVAILAKPCNDRGSCHELNNTDDVQYRCYNRQVVDHDLNPAPQGNLWGIAGGAFNLANWPSKTAKLLREENMATKWMLQAGGWGAGAFGCGTLYGGLVQALAAKKGGWKKMRMCWASGKEPFPPIASKMGFVLGNKLLLRKQQVLHAESYKPLMTGEHVGNFMKGKLFFKDEEFGAVAAQLRKQIPQYIPPPTCATLECNKPWNKNGNCISNMEWCCGHGDCPWHQNKAQDLRDFMAASCNEGCGVAKGFCTLEHVPKRCRATPAPTPSPTPLPSESGTFVGDDDAEEPE
mmetsp:Transcript_115820/g.327644  ORF Transcript_115820/g.327644 Transcript_115820/m.327644 type:complete len:740 (-) Transcript_115820:354-2573(-)